MARVALRQIIGRQPDARALVDADRRALGAPVAVEDADGRLLHGEASVRRRRALSRSPHDGQRSVGWPAVPIAPPCVAALLEH